MAYRRSALEALGGFDERFPRAYREDADLALRARRAGYQLTVGDRSVSHPVRPARWWVSIGRQRGNGDDALMRRAHGRRWRDEADVPPGAYRAHLMVTTALGLAVAGAVTGRRGWTAAGIVGWAAGTARFAWRRIAPGPRTPGEVAAMAVTSAVIPLAAVGHRALGFVRALGAQPWGPGSVGPASGRRGARRPDRTPGDADASTDMVASLPPARDSVTTGSSGRTSATGGTGGTDQTSLAGTAR
jgi:hypothetical protein